MGCMNFGSNTSAQGCPKFKQIVAVNIEWLASATKKDAAVRFAQHLMPMPQICARARLLK